MAIPTDPFAWADPSREDFEDRLREFALTRPRSWDPLSDDRIVKNVSSSLVRLKRQVEDEIAGLSAERSAFQAECYAMGNRGRQRWFNYEKTFKARKFELTTKARLFEDGLIALKPYVMELKQRESRDEAAAYMAIKESGASDVETLRNVLRSLAVAVTEHREAIEYAGNAPTVSDRALWSCLSRLKMPTRGGEISLREWVSRTVLHEGEKSHVK